MSNRYEVRHGNVSKNHENGMFEFLTFGITDAEQSHTVAFLLESETAPLLETIRSQADALDAQSQELARVKSVIKKVIDGLENAPSDSEELKKAQPRFIIESLNEWHAILLHAYKNTETDESLSRLE